VDLSTSNSEPHRRRDRRSPGRQAAFIAIAALTFLALLMLVRSIDGNPLAAPDTGFGNGGFVWYYRDDSVDYNIFRLNLFGVGDNIRRADIIFYGSSKGLFAFRTDIISPYVNQPNAPQVKLFNASLAFGEGVGFLDEIVKSLDLRNKILIVDLSVQAARYSFSSKAKKALAENTLAAYETTASLWLRYGFDRLFAGFLPRLHMDGSNWGLEPRIGVWHSRSWTTGNDTSRKMQPKYPVITGTVHADFDPDGRLRKFFVDECRERGIDVIFTTVPTGAGQPGQDASDDAWAQRAANQLGLPYVKIASTGLYTHDSIHLDPASAALFSEHLGEALAAPPISIAHRLQRLHWREP
jgi:hypothetical protein